MAKAEGQERKHRDRCEASEKELLERLANLEAKLASGTAAPAAPSPAAGGATIGPDLNARIADVARRVLGEGADLSVDPAKLLADVDARLADIISERNGLRTSVRDLGDRAGAAEQRAAKAEQALAERIKRDDAERAKALDAVLEKRRCASLTRATNGTTVTVSGVVGTADEAAAISAEIERALPGTQVSLKALGGAVCLTALADGWYVGHVEVSGEARYAVELGAAVRGLAGHLPEGTTACGEGMQKLLANGALAGRVGIADETTDVWSRRGTSVVYCRSDSPRDGKSWRMGRNPQRGKTAILLLKVEGGAR